MLLHPLRRIGGIICLAALPLVLAATTAGGHYVRSQLSAHASLPEARDALVREVARQKLVALGFEEDEAMPIIDAALASGLAEALVGVFRKAQSGEAGESRLADEGLQQAMTVFALELNRSTYRNSEMDSETIWAYPFDQTTYAFSSKVVGFNIPGILLWLAPVVIVVAVAAASGGSAGSLVAVGAAVGLIMILFVDPSILFGSRE
jgi:hypothetical protein